MLKEIIPHLSPHLFPHIEVNSWGEKPVYQKFEVLELEERIREIRSETERKIVEIDLEIKKIKNSYSYERDLLTKQGEELKKAVIKSLKALGFKDVINIDEELKKQGVENLREDLQIQGQPPLLLVEVTGIANLPQDETALKVAKYLFPRAKELGHSNIQGLGIINHQRNLEPLDRENVNPFKDEILVNAEKMHFGLLTTWDLFRLVRSYQKNKWDHKNIRPIFYKLGRIEPVPMHYELVGTIERFIADKGVVGVKIDDGKNICKMDTIAFEFPAIYDEQKVESLQFENQVIETGSGGQVVGIKTNFTKGQMKKGIRVFKANHL